MAGNAPDNQKQPSAEPNLMLSVSNFISACTESSRTTTHTERTSHKCLMVNRRCVRATLDACLLVMPLVDT